MVSQLSGKLTKVSIDATRPKYITFRDLKEVEQSVGSVFLNHLHNELGPLGLLAKICGQTL